LCEPRFEFDAVVQAGQGRVFEQSRAFVSTMSKSQSCNTGCASHLHVVRGVAYH
jgi:hypothetical protein